MGVGVGHTDESGGGMPEAPIQRWRGLPVLRKTPGGQPSTNAAVIEELALERLGHPWRPGGGHRPPPPLVAAPVVPLSAAWLGRHNTEGVHQLCVHNFGTVFGTVFFLNNILVLFSAEALTQLSSAPMMTLPLCITVYF